MQDQNDVQKHYKQQYNQLLADKFHVPFVALDVDLETINFKSNHFNKYNVIKIRDYLQELEIELTKGVNPYVVLEFSHFVHQLNNTPPKILD